AVERFLYEAGFPYASGYGLTETSPLLAGCTPSVVRFRATGVIIPGVEARIFKPDTRSKIGEIQVKGPTVMKGYFRDKQRSDEAFTSDGWFKTGDLGTMRDGYLYIKGRIKNVIIGPRGENIYPEELESKLNEQEIILESLVYEWENKICARVFLNYEIIDKNYGIGKMGSISAEKKKEKLLDEIRKLVNSQVSSFSVIHKLTEQKEPFEKTPTQKIKRFLYQN
ncbi:MAG: AMP-binding protein, partial [Candidatus Cloacimonetes bacterium]|nr:AMP-binding protein [Candidatus Cloacimonadota bacterium]